MTNIKLCIITTEYSYTMYLKFYKDLNQNTFKKKIELIKQYNMDVERIVLKYCLFILLYILYFLFYQLTKSYYIFNNLNLNIFV